MSFRVGIVGCGSIAHTHARVLDQLEKTHLAACADIRPERAQAFSDRYGCRPYNSIHALLENEALDAVPLCVPHYLHAPMAALAAEHGVAVMCEKPPVTQRAQWPLLEAAAEKVPLAFCFQNRYNENVRALREILASGRYGAVRGARAFLTWDRQAPYYTESGWRGAWETEGGGVLINQCVHTLDLLVTLLGKPETVEAHMANHHLRGVIEVEATGLPVGLGSHVSADRRLDARLAGAMMSIQAVKGVEIGEGFGYAELPGSLAHDEMFYDETDHVVRKTNHAGGLEGGMTNGEPIVVRAVMKPIPTLMKPLHSVDIAAKQPVLASKERSDVCAVSAASVVGEAMTALTIAAAVTEKFGGDAMRDLLDAVRAYRERIC